MKKLVNLVKNPKIMVPVALLVASTVGLAVLAKKMKLDEIDEVGNFTSIEE